MNEMKAFVGKHTNWPLICDVLVILWTMSIFRYTTYSDFWASYPVAAMFVINVGLHIFIMTKEKFKPRSIGYAVLHIPVSFTLYILCAVLITKDFL